MKIKYNNRKFRSIHNSGSGEVDSETIFHYRQRDNVIWATYEGGAIRHGTLCGIVTEDERLDFRYAHVNRADEIMTGRCLSTPRLLPDGRIRLREEWQWTSGDLSSGQSEIEEI